MRPMEALADQTVQPALVSYVVRHTAAQIAGRPIDVIAAVNAVHTHIVQNQVSVGAGRQVQGPTSHQHARFHPHLKIIIVPRIAALHAFHKIEAGILDAQTEGGGGVVIVIRFKFVRAGSARRRCAGGGLGGFGSWRQGKSR